jgi:membrane protease YdiL (CAAX protease family)
LTLLPAGVILYGVRLIARDTLISLALAVPVLIWVALTGQSNPWNLKTAAIYLVAAPVTEEIVFRGGVQEALLNKFSASLPKETANIITSVLFALLHLVFRRELAALLVFFPSFALGWHYRMHRNLKVVIFIHFFYNFILFL